MATVAGNSYYAMLKELNEQDDAANVSTQRGSVIAARPPLLNA
jgi:hypothetical protein